MATSRISCNLARMKKTEGLLLDQLLTSTQHRKVYRYLRKVEGVQPFSFRGLAQELGLSSHDSITRALDTLGTFGLVTKSTEGGVNTFVVNPVQEHLGRPRNFRGTSSISITAWTPDLSPTLDAEEEEQLYLQFEDTPRVAALYILLRQSLGSKVTKMALSRRFVCQDRSLNAMLDTLDEDGLIELRPKSSIAVGYASLGFDEVVPAATVRNWLKESAMVPPVESVTKANVLHSVKLSESQRLTAFYRLAMESRGLQPSNGPRQYAAKNITSGVSADSLFPALLFFVFHWDHEIVEKYGRTLTTFAMNLPLIQEEAKQMMDTYPAPGYVARMMEKYGLAAFFPIPEVKETAAKKETLSPARLATLRQLNCDTELYAEDSLEAEWVRENGVAS